MSRDKRLQDRSIYPHWCTDTVRFSDQDAAGHVNNVALCAYLETARLTFIRDMGMMARGEDGVRGISAGMNVSFLAELHWPGQVELGTGVISDRHQLDHRRIGRLQGRGLHRRGRDDGGPAQGQDAPSDRPGPAVEPGKVPPEGLSGRLTGFGAAPIFASASKSQLHGNGRHVHVSLHLSGHSGTRCRRRRPRGRPASRRRVPGLRQEPAMRHLRLRPARAHRPDHRA